MSYCMVDFFNLFSNFYLFYFTILYWFCHTSTWVHHGCTWVPNPEPPSHLPPYTIPLGYPSAPTPSILYHASNLDWWFISYTILCMWRGPKKPLDESEEEIKNAGLKLNIQKTKIMASGPITSWQIDGETMETVTDFVFLGSKITADGDCSYEIKRCLFLGRKAMINLGSILKGRDITLPTKIHLVKAMVFPVVMYGCGSWTIKKAACRRINAFELLCWRRLLRVPWTARSRSPS